MLFLSLSFPLFVAASALSGSGGDQERWNAQAEALIRVFPAWQERRKSRSLMGKTSWNFHPQVANQLHTFQWTSETQLRLNPERHSVLWLVASKVLKYEHYFKHMGSSDEFTGPRYQDPHSLNWILVLSCCTTPYYCHLVLHFVPWAWNVPLPSIVQVLYGNPAMLFPGLLGAAVHMNWQSKYK